MKRSLCLVAALLAFQVSEAISFYPHSDPDNAGNWVLVENMSDEFETNVLDHAKWQVCGKDGVFWAGTFKGRGYAEGAYSENGSWQYSPDNVQVTNGLLKITTQYEPGYPFLDPTAYDWKFTTGGIWSKASCTNGYMEIRCKLANEEQTGAFWTTGGGAELDVFEATGKHASRQNKMWSSIHDWTLGSQPNIAWTDTTSLPFDFSDGFHTYAAEWDTDSVKIYADGVLIHSTTKAWVEANGPNSKRWPLTGLTHVWADSEIFPWWGVPDTNNPPSDFEVEYIRVWQKGPAFLWDEYVAAYDLSGIKTNYSDTDTLSDWAEYVFNGNPTNASDIGVQPTFDAATGDYTFQIRNDVLLKAHVLTKTNLDETAWSTNESVSIELNDGSMATNHIMLGLSADQLFVELLIEELTPPLVYPPSKGNTVADEWIAHVHIGSINRTSGADGGYYDGTALSTTAAKGSSVSVSLTTGYSSTVWPEVWRIWIDLNHDGDFTDAGEIVFSPALRTSASPLTGTFTLPSTYSYTGSTRMRVSMKYDAAPTSDEIFQYGEVEDYTIIIE